jgi:hypothetical protein
MRAEQNTSYEKLIMDRGLGSEFLHGISSEQPAHIARTCGGFRALL